MEETSWLVARDLTELNHVLTLVPRDGTCKQCDKNVQLKCPKCPDGQSCQYTVPLDCTQCPESACMPSGDSDNSGSGSGGGGKGGPSAGPIAGGVIGGIVVIAIVTYLVWRFLIKPKRSANHIEYEPNLSSPRSREEKDTTTKNNNRLSTHTVHSIASTVLTRASNIIQIAYIPGVTNRATPTSPNVLVPPVPPIPMHHSEGNGDLEHGDQHFFVPGNLRDSTYSGISNYTDRTSYAPTSYGPRSSIASTIYGRQAQVQTPAQTGMRAKPTVVSVKSGTNSAANTPPVPNIDFEKFNSPRPKSGASAFSVGSTFLNNANTASQARAQVVKAGGSLKTIEIGSKSEASSSTTSVNMLSPNDTQGHPISPASRTASPAQDQGPFSDPIERLSPSGTTAPPTLGAVIEEDPEHPREGDRATRRPGSGDRGRSPFSDEHATRD